MTQWADLSHRPASTSRFDHTYSVDGKPDIDSAEYLRAANRYWCDPSDRYSNLGLRPARVIP